MAHQQFLAGAEPHQGHGAEHIIEDAAFSRRPLHHTLGPLNLLGDIGMILPQRRHGKPVFCTSNPLDIRIGIIEIAVAHDLDHVHARIPIQLKMLLHRLLSQILIRRKMIPEPHGNPVHGLVFKCVQKPFSFCHSHAPLCCFMLHPSWQAASPDTPTPASRKKCSKSPL